MVSLETLPIGSQLNFAIVWLVGVRLRLHTFQSQGWVSQSTTVSSPWTSRGEAAAQKLIKAVICPVYLSFLEDSLYLVLLFFRAHGAMKASHGGQRVCAARQGSMTQHNL
jgi:hypothetical protein